MHEQRDAGPGLDAEIAERVLGWKRGKRFGNGNGEWIIDGQNAGLRRRWTRPTSRAFRREARMAEHLTVEQHQAQLESRSWPGVPELAARWGISRATVRKIPRDRLPYLDFGGTHIRRYDPVDIAAYEEREKQGAAA